jgi:hypothetical protein
VIGGDASECAHAYKKRVGIAQAALAFLTDEREESLSVVAVAGHA